MTTGFVVLALSLASCGGSSDGETTTTEDDVETSADADEDTAARPEVAATTTTTTTTTTLPPIAAPTSSVARDDDVAPPDDAADFVDEFDGSLGVGWSWDQPDPSRHSLMAAPGWLAITAQDRFPPTNLLLRDAPAGSFEMTTALRFTPEENFQAAGLIVVGGDANNYSQVGRAFCDLDFCVDDGVYFDNWRGADQLGGGSLALENAPEIVHLRLTVVGNEYTASFSVDGENWMVVGTHVREFTTRRIGLVAHQAATEITAEFAYFTLAELERETVGREGVQYVATGFESGGFSPDIWLSTDLVAWERIDTGMDVPLRDVAWNGRHWIATGDALIATSPNGRDWTARLDWPEIRAFHFYDAAWGGEQWTVVGNFQILGNPTSDWTGETFGASEDGMVLQSIASNGEQWVAVGNGWQVLSYESPTGTAFALRHGAPQDFEADESLADVLWAVAWGDGHWVAVGEDGRMLVSLDGIGWTDADSGTNEMLRSVAHNGTSWMVASGLGNIFTSADGLEWQRTAGRPNTNEIVDIIWDGCQWVATGDGVHTSADGSSWVRHEVDALITKIAVAYDQPCAAAQ